MDEKVSLFTLTKVLRGSSLGFTLVLRIGMQTVTSSPIVTASSIHWNPFICDSHERFLGAEEAGLSFSSDTLPLSAARVWNTNHQPRRHHPYLRFFVPPSKIWIGLLWREMCHEINMSDSELWTVTSSSAQSVANSARIPSSHSACVSYVTINWLWLPYLIFVTVTTVQKLTGLQRKFGPRREPQTSSVRCVSLSLLWSFLQNETVCNVCHGIG